MKVVLELQDQPSNIKKVTIRHDIVIGRGAECNLRLSAPQVSRRHTFLRISSGSATVTDLDSSNGTYLNGKRITSGKRYKLEDGVRLAIGPVQFTARVHAEVLASEMMEVNVNDDRIEAEAAAPVSPEVSAGDSNGDDDFAATVSDSHLRDDSSSLNFAVESAGPAADEDEPTTDYKSSDAGSYLGDVNDGRSRDSSTGKDDSAASVLGDLPDDGDPPTINSVDEDLMKIGSDVAQVIDNDLQIVDVLDDVEVLDEVEVLDDEVEVLDVIEVVEDEVVVVGEDEVEVTDEDTISIEDSEMDELIEDDEVLVIDDDDPAQDDDSGDKVENELRNFLKGLD